MDFLLQGAVASLVIGVVFLLLVGFGQPKPPIPTKPFSVDSCPVNNGTSYVAKAIIGTAPDTTEYLFENPPKKLILFTTSTIASFTGISGCTRCRTCGTLP